MQQKCLICSVIFANVVVVCSFTAKTALADRAMDSLNLQHRCGVWPKISKSDPLSPVNCESGPLWIGSVVPELVLPWGRELYPAEGGGSHQGCHFEGVKTRPPERTSVLPGKNLDLE